MTPQAKKTLRRASKKKATFEEQLLEAIALLRAVMMSVDKTMQRLHVLHTHEQPPAYGPSPNGLAPPPIPGVTPGHPAPLPVTHAPPPAQAYPGDDYYAAEIRERIETMAAANWVLSQPDEQNIITVTDNLGHVRGKLGQAVPGQFDRVIKALNLMGAPE